MRRFNAPVPSHAPPRSAANRMPQPDRPEAPARNLKKGAMMKSTTTLAAAFGLAIGFSATAALACTTEKKKDDLTDAEAMELYDCIKDDLLARFQKSGRPEAEAYRSWTVNSTNPFISATHGNRFVIHYANDVAAETYGKYAEEGVTMPVGSVLGKESFTISKEGEVRAGPLFLMEKVESLPEFDNWQYTTILPNGKVGGPKPSFCHDCHKNVLEGQDAMFYPDVDYRVSSN